MFTLISNMLYSKVVTKECNKRIKAAKTDLKQQKQQKQRTEQKQSKRIESREEKQNTDMALLKLARFVWLRARTVCIFSKIIDTILSLAISRCLYFMSEIDLSFYYVVLVF